MDPKTQTPIREAPPVSIPNQPGEPESLKDSAGGNSKTLKYAVLGLFVATLFVLILGVGYYFLIGNKSAYNAKNQAMNYISPTTTPTPSPITAVYNSKDLTNLMNELNKADSSLDSELSSLKQDSNF